MKKIVIIFAVLLMGSGATISILKWLKLGPFEETAAIEEEVVEPEIPPVVISMEDLNIPIFSDDSVAATVMVRLKIQVIGPENEAEVVKKLPRLGDAFFKDLYVFIPRVLRHQNKLTSDILVEKLKRTADKVMEPGVIDDIIVDELAQN